MSRNWKNEGILGIYRGNWGFSNRKPKITSFEVINLALTYLKLKKFNFAIKASDEALRLDPQLLRRCLEGLGRELLI